MNKWFIVLCALTVLTIVGCGSSKLTPEEQAQVKQVEPIVRECIQKNKTTKTILNCIAPGAHKAALEKCVTKAAFHDLPTGRYLKLRKDATICVVKNR